MDRRTNRPEGSGGASPTIVTSWAGDDEDNDGETSASGSGPAPPRTKPAEPKQTSLARTFPPCPLTISDWHAVPGRPRGSLRPRIFLLRIFRRRVTPRYRRPSRPPEIRLPRWPRARRRSAPRPRARRSRALRPRAPRPPVRRPRAPRPLARRSRAPRRPATGRRRFRLGDVRSAAELAVSSDRELPEGGH